MDSLQVWRSPMEGEESMKTMKCVKTKQEECVLPPDVMQP